MNKNTIIAIALSFLVLLLWFRLTTPPEQRKTKVSDTALPSQAESSIAHPMAAKVMKQAPNEVTADYFFILENEFSKIKLNSRGGVSSWLLKEDEEHNVELVSSAKLLPLTISPLVTFEEDAYISNNQTLSLNGNMSTDVEVNLTYNHADSKDLVNIKIDLKNTSDSALEISNFKIGIGPGLGTDEKIGYKQQVKNLKPLICSNAKVTKKIKERIIPVENSWIGITNHYFLSILIDKNNTFNRVIKTGDKIPNLTYIKNITIGPQEVKTIEFDTLWTLKDYNYLKSFNQKFEKSLSLGIFGDIGKFVLFLLNKFYTLTGNYGLAIILITTLFQIILFPLTRKSVKSMQAMKKIQPEMNNLKIKYKDEPQKLNTEMMALYKKRKVNPFGGCLPLLLQLPIFWALFTTLRNAAELRHAPFVFWIKDLSAPDTIMHIAGVPINILPLLMGGMMFISQKLNSPGGGDPSQNKIMTLMPIMFTFMFWNFPSGLVLYWFVSNIYTVGINLWLSRRNG